MYGAGCNLSLQAPRNVHVSLDNLGKDMARFERFQASLKLPRDKQPAAKLVLAKAEEKAQQMIFDAALKMMDDLKWSVA